MKKSFFISFILAALTITSCGVHVNPSNSDETQSNSQSESQSDLVLESISASGYTTTYNVNDVFSFDGVLTAKYSDNSEKVVAPSYVSSPNMSTVGEKDVTISYTENSVTKFTSYTINVKEQSIPSTLDLNKFNQTKNNILTGHNYTAHIQVLFEGETTPHQEYNLVNINNNVIYTDDNAYFNNGYIKQKNQGIVKFFQNKESGVLVPGDFVATNTERGMDEIYILAIENIINVNFSIDSGKNAFTAQGKDPVAIIGNLGFGDYVIWASAPKNNQFYAFVENDDYSSFRLSAAFVYNSIEEDFNQTPVVINITVNNIGTTKNDILEQYVSDPSYTYPTPTEWDSSDIEIFNSRFGDTIPPFMNGLSYSYKCGETLIDGKYYGIVEDYASGNLTNSYASILLAQDFALVDGTYVKTSLDSSGKRELKWTVSFNYYAPTAKDEYGMEYGYLFPNGVFTALFRYSENLLDDITTIEELNSYIKYSTAVGDFLPEFPTDCNATKVTGFNDGTAAAADEVAFVAPNSGGFFKIYIQSYDDALKFINEYGTALETKLGFSTKGLGSFFMASWTDDYSSYVYFSDIVYARKIDNNYDYPGYIQVQILIWGESLENYEPGTPSDATLTGISVSKQTTTFTVGDTFIFDGEVTATYSDGTTKVVTPTSVTTPDMSTTGEKTVTVSYTENDVTRKTSYEIEVKPVATLYSISLVGGSGLTIKVTKPDSLKSESGKTVIFYVNITEGYKLDSLTVTDANNNEITVEGPNIMTGAYQFTMPNGNVTITAKASLTGEPIPFGGEYSLTIPMTNPEYYHLYKFTFNSDGTGTYERYRNNAEGFNLVASLTFTYTISGNNVTLTLKAYTLGDATSYQTGYRLYPDNSYSINPYGSYDDEGHFIIQLAYANGDLVEQTFNK